MGIPIGSNLNQGVYHPQNKKTSTPIVNGVPFLPTGTPPPVYGDTSFQYPTGPMQTKYGVMPSHSALDLWALQQRKLLGVRRAFGTGTEDEQMGDVELLAGFLPFNIGGKAKIGEEAVEQGPGLLSKITGWMKGGGAADRVKGYPTGSPPASKYPLSRMGEHAQFGPEIQNQRRVSSAPTIQEHLQNLDNLKAAQELTKARGGFGASPNDLMGIETKPPGQIPPALDIMLKREQESMPYANELIRYIRRASESRPDDSLLFANNMDLLRGLKPKGTPKKAKTLMPSANSPEGAALRQLMENYGDVGGSPLADRGAGLAKPIWQRGEGTPGDFLGQAGPRPEAYDREFDNWSWQDDMMVPDEGTGAPFIPRQEKNARAREGKGVAEWDQNMARVQEPHVKFGNLLNQIVGVERGSKEPINELMKLLGNYRAYNSFNGGGGYPSWVLEGGAVGNPQDWLSMLMRSPMGYTRRGPYSGN